MPPEATSTPTCEAHARPLGWRRPGSQGHWDASKWLAIIPPPPSQVGPPSGILKGLTPDQWTARQVAEQVRRRAVAAAALQPAGSLLCSRGSLCVPTPHKPDPRCRSPGLATPCAFRPTLGVDCPLRVLREPVHPARSLAPNASGWDPALLLFGPGPHRPLDRPRHHWPARVAEQRGGGGG